MKRNDDDCNDSLSAAARTCLEARETDEKIALTRAVVARWRAGELAWQLPDPNGRPALSVDDVRPGLPSRLRLVAPLAVPKRKLSSARGRAAFVHAVAHIELNAVNLAWDCVYRFRGLPRSFYDDWTSVADDEARHFTLLDARLRELDTRYGDLEAHDSLWEMAEKTRDDLAARMAMVPRVLEARGLDVTPGMIARLRKAGDERTAAILETILEEEIAHVAAGTRWFRFACHARSEDPERRFAELVSLYMKGRVRGPLNHRDRRRAGFSDAELAALTAMIR